MSCCFFWFYTSSEKIFYRSLGCPWWFVKTLASWFEFGLNTCQAGRQTISYSQLNIPLFLNSQIVLQGKGNLDFQGYKRCNSFACGFLQFWKKLGRRISRKYCIAMQSRIFNVCASFSWRAGQARKYSCPPMTGYDVFTSKKFFLGSLFL